MSLCRQFIAITLVFAAVPVIAQDVQGTIALTNVTVIDCTGVPANSDMTLIITGDRITSIGKADTVIVPAGARVIDGAGKFVIPGLWDMHVHSRAWAPPLFLANGVTGVRVMSGNPDLVEQKKYEGAIEYRGQRRESLVDVPPIPILRSSVASPIIDGPRPIHAGSIAVRDAEQARKVVRRLKSLGYDFLKVYDRLPREAYYTIVEEAKLQRIRFAGHVPNAVSAGEASDAGQATIEHLTGIYAACSTHEAELLKQWLSPAMRRMARDTYDEAEARNLFAKFARNVTWHVPTLTVLRWGAFADRKWFVQDPRLRFIEPTEKKRWLERGRRWVASSRNIPLQRRDFEQDLRVVSKMHKSGVRLLAGTDMGNPFCMPGFSLHDELELLVSAGLSPMESLQTATRNPAEYLGRLRELGTIENGKLADVVLLSANPLDDINNVRKINSVIFAGRLYTRSQLDEILLASEMGSEIFELAEAFTPGGLAELSRHRPLDRVLHVSLASANIGDDALAICRETPRLESLDLRGTRIRGPGLDYLSGLKQLEELILGQTQVDDASLANLTKLTELTVLRLGGTNISDAGLAHLLPLAHLADLGLAGTRITDVGAAQLRNLRSLSRLSLIGTRITDAALRHLTRLPLVTLLLTSTDISNEGLNDLAQIKTLRRLDLTDTLVTPEGVKRFQRSVPDCEVTMSRTR